MEAKQDEMAWNVVNGLRDHLNWVLSIANMFLFPKKKKKNDLTEDLTDLLRPLLRNLPNALSVGTAIKDIIKREDSNFKVPNISFTPYLASPYKLYVKPGVQSLRTEHLHRIPASLPSCQQP